METGNETLSVSELYVLGKKRYGNKQNGLENWKTDLLKFVTQEFHDRLNSSSVAEQKKANDEVTMWINATDVSFFFRGSWGDQSDSRSKALQYLHHAQLLEHKFNDQFVIQVINRAIRSGLENRYQMMD